MVVLPNQLIWDPPPTCHYPYREGRHSSCHFSHAVPTFADLVLFLMELVVLAYVPAVALEFQAFPSC